MAVRKNQGGGESAALPPEPAEVAPEPIEEPVPPLPPVMPPPATYVDLFKRELAARFRFEVSHAFDAIRVTGHFGDIGCTKTWTFPFGLAWAEEALATIKAWKASRLG